ncbi:DNA mismatch repair protein MutS [Lacticaseibacillus parahuelsenbergensis]|uniref:DNA mismatch repair protein MutS n=1 Tax=Lacticaseibacillus parahuelsenbergensis TaxID=3068305 RepID=A0ABY9L4F0_9LACO|nr:MULTISPECIES: DNA mismatch repair protein MutS [Lacticaseibacillus]MDE3281677.1 DNA mismatch repair protein MutS [Lacticaseibacillus casei]WLV78612.1 DNA mismatch repair protein MutS [Lacticaseibacillus sp. NCIMB 15471]
MTQPVIILLGVGGFAVAVVVLNLLLAWRRQAKLKRQLLADWGTLPVKRGGSERYLKAAYLDHEAQVNHDCLIDDLTWRDLDMFEVFKQLNATQSSVGAERVYAQLRAYDLGRPDVNETLIDFFRTHAEERLKVQLAFAGLGTEAANNSQHYLRTTTQAALPHAWRFKALGGLPVVGLLLIPLLPALGVAVATLSLLVNLFYYVVKREALDTEVMAMGYLVRTIVTAEHLVKIAQPTQAALRTALKPMRGITRLAFVFRTRDNSSADMMTEYFSSMFMLGFIAYNNVLTRLHNRHAEALTLWQALGDLELAIAIANFREAHANSSQPVFADGGLTAKELVHPLLKHPVANPVDWQKNALITGANASGKSTYVKSIAVNAILAQTINTVLAKDFSIQPGLVITAMAIRDDLSEGDSYFVAEIKAIHRLLNAVATNKRIYGFIDEILKGTNTVERIAASASVINWLSHYPSLVVVATHDNELTDIMGEQCVNWHFQEKVTKKDGVVFDYLLHQGPATSHNAITLLATMAYPATLIKDARTLAADFERTKVWPRYRQGGIKA